MLMGATLPAIARWKARRATTRNRSACSTWPTSPEPRAARCSRASTCCASTTRSSRPRSRSRLNVIVAAVFWRLAARSPALTHLRHPRHPRHPKHPRHPRHPRHLFIRPRPLSGFTALGAEVVWTRQLSLLFGASVYTFSLILAVFLTGLGHRRPGRIATRAANAGSAIDAWRRSRRARGGDRVRRVGDRQRAARVATDGAVPPERSRHAVAGVCFRCAAVCVRTPARDHPVGRELPVDAGVRRARFRPATSRASTRSTPRARSPARSRLR